MADTLGVAVTRCAHDLFEILSSAFLRHRSTVSDLCEQLPTACILHDKAHVSAQATQSGGRRAALVPRTRHRGADAGHDSEAGTDRSQKMTS